MKRSITSRTWRSCSAAILLLSSLAQAENFHRGVCFAHAWKDGLRRGYGTETSKASLERLRGLGVDSVSLTPFGYQISLSSTEVRMAHGWRGGETDQAVAAAARQARALGIRVMLKPHVWIRGGAWIGAQELRDETAWARWFESYRAFILHYARLAEAEKMEWLVLGTELKRASSHSRARWAGIVAEIRKIYRGKLTYAANWDEADLVVFWDLVDAVGVQAYEPPTRKPGAALEDLRAGWRAIITKLQVLSQRTKKPILITELGYRAAPDAALDPSAWPEASQARFDGAHQAACYRAALEALSSSAWCGGIYIWKWFSDSADEQGPTDFSPAGKPAENVLREFYRRGSPQ